MGSFSLWLYDYVLSELSRTIMAYDKKTGTINIGAKDTQADFERDMFAHFAHVEKEVAKELEARKKAKSLSGRL